jgi:predicted P-loop ATPase
MLYLDYLGVVDMTFNQAGSMVIFVVAISMVVYMKYVFMLCIRGDTKKVKI